MVAFFKKKTEEDQLPDLSMPPEFPPVSPDFRPQQLRDLTNRGYPSPELSSAGESFGMRPAGPVFARPGLNELPTGMPQAPQFRAPPPRTIAAEIEEVAEAIVSEKWEKLSKELDDIKKSGEDLSATVGGMQERMSNLEKKMDMIIQEILGKVDDYGRGISDVSTELKAMQKVFGTMMPTMTDNIKELQGLVDTAKTKGISRKRTARRPAKRRTKAKRRRR